MFLGSEKPVEKKPQKLFFKHILRKIFLEDWVLKLVALGITLGLWFGVTGLSTPTTRRFSAVPLTLFISNDTEITNSPVQEVDIVVSGDKRKLDQINRSDVSAQMDLSDLRPGEQAVSLTPQTVSISLPLGVKLDEIQPSRIAVNLEAVMEKEVPVNVQTEGAPASGFEVYSETAAPARVRVRGPASVVRLLDSISTDKINVAGKNGDFTMKQVAMNVANPKTTVLDPVVDVAVRIGEKRIERTFLVPVSGYPGKKAITMLYGPRTLLAGLRPENLKVEIVKDATGADTPHLDLPDTLQGSVEVRKLTVH